jgi:hypothetical protein
VTAASHAAPASKVKIRNANPLNNAFEHIALVGGKLSVSAIVKCRWQSRLFEPVGDRSVSTRRVPRAWFGKTRHYTNGGAQTTCEMGAGIAASPHCAERWVYRCSFRLHPLRSFMSSRSWLTSSGVASSKSSAPSSGALSLPSRPAPLREPAANSSSAVACLAPFPGLSPLQKSARSLAGPNGRPVLLEEPDFASAVSSLAAPDPNPKVQFLACLPFNPASSNLRSLRPSLSFRGPSWDDHSFRRPGNPCGPPDLQHEEDQLFRRLLPASLPEAPSIRSPNSVLGMLPLTGPNLFPSPAGGDRVGRPLPVCPISGPLRPGSLPPITIER